MGHTDALVDDVLGSLVSLGLDHDHLLEGGSDADEEVASFTLFSGGVDDVAIAQVSHIGGSNGAIPGNIGRCDSDGSAQGSDDLNRVLVVVSHDGAGNNSVVTQLLVEQRTHGTVDDTAVQDAALGGLALTTVERAGDTAHRVHSLLELDGQREVVDTSLGDGVAGAGSQHHGVAVAADALGVGQLSHLTGLNGKRTAADLHFEDLMVGESLASNHEIYLLKFMCVWEV